MSISFFDLSLSEKQKIINGAGEIAQKDMQKVIKEYYKDRVHLLGSHGAIMFTTRNKDLCAECGEPIKRESGE